MIRVLYLSAHSSNGGAAKVATTLQECLQLDCRIIYLTEDNIIARQKSSLSKALLSATFLLRRKIGRIPSLLDSFEPRVYKSYSFLPSFLPLLIRILDVDLVHLHWVQGEFLSIEDMLFINKPIVWTLHDSWPFSASEHHNLQHLGDTPHQYAKLPLLNPSRLTYLRKRLFWRNLNIYPVAPSHWMYSKASSSTLFKDKKIHLIPNPINLDTYHPIAKNLARTELNLDPSIKYLLVGSLASSSDPIKGIDLLNQAIRELSLMSTQTIHILTLGALSSTYFPGCECVPMGHIGSDEQLSIIYSAAHVTLIPSRIETHSQTAAESISCGTPVVAFDVAGNPSVVKHNKTGLLVPPFDTKLFASAINHLLTHGLQQTCPKSFSEESAKWNNRKVSNQYLALYESILLS